MNEPCIANTADLLRHEALKQGVNAELMLRAAALIGMLQDFLAEQSRTIDRLEQQLARISSLPPT